MSQFGLRNLFKQRRPPAGTAAAGIISEHWPRRVYAIGDIHGRYDLLSALERTIVADAGPSAEESYIVTLGDMIDRGPESRQVLEHLMRPIPGFTRIALMGNHEAMLLDFLADPSPASIWLRNGGVETLRSFGLDPATLVALPYPERAPLLHRTLGDTTLQFLRSLPAYASFPGTVLVHAGIRPGIPISQQRQSDLLWIRDPFLKAERDDGLLVVHGHTASGMPQFGHGRIGIDTGAYETGILTCACLEPGKPPRLLPVGPLLMWSSIA